jgi:hypothetical protein
MEADVADIIPALILGDRPHVDGMGDLVEGAVEPVHAFDGTDVGRAQRMEAQMIAYPLRPAEKLEILDRMRRPSGNIARQLPEHRKRALPAPEVNRFRDIGPRAQRDEGPEPAARQRTIGATMQRFDPPVLGAGKIGKKLHRRVAILDAALIEERRGAHEIADIGDGPGLAGLDEGIFMKLLDILFDDIGLGIDDVEEPAQAAATLLVALADESRDQIVEAVAFRIREGHVRAPPPL